MESVARECDRDGLYQSIKQHRESGDWAEVYELSKRMEAADPENWNMLAYLSVAEADGNGIDLARLQRAIMLCPDPVIRKTLRCIPKYVVLISENRFHVTSPENDRISFNMPAGAYLLPPGDYSLTPSEKITLGGREFQILDNCWPMTAYNPSCGRINLDEDRFSVRISDIPVQVLTVDPSGIPDLRHAEMDHALPISVFRRPGVPEGMRRIDLVEPDEDQCHVLVKGIRSLYAGYPIRLYHDDGLYFYVEKSDVPVLLKYQYGLADPNALEIPSDVSKLSVKLVPLGRTRTVGLIFKKDVTDHFEDIEFIPCHDSR